MNDQIKVKSYASSKERELRKQLMNDFKNTPIPEDELFANLGLFLSRHQMCRMLWMNEIYQKSLNVHGNVMEFGCRWGQNLALFHHFRSIYEPFNMSRKIIGFDTFAGFPSVDEKDGGDDIVGVGNYSTTTNYDEYLEKILNFHEQINPNPHFKKFEIVKGDATKTVKQYLEEHPETIVSLAYFDMDIYEPTKACLEAIAGHLTKGSVIAFDELNMQEFPGETVAVREVLGLSNVRIVRSPHSQFQSYMIVE